MTDSSDALTKFQRLLQLQRLFWCNPGLQYKTQDIAEMWGLSVSAALRCLKEFSGPEGFLPITTEGRYWKLMEGARYDLIPVTLNLPEGAALFVAARLLSQIHDERNEHVLSALLKLVEAMPETIAPHLQATIQMARERQQNQPDASAIFEALARGWARRKLVTVTYDPPRLRSFTCDFAPYLMEPSPTGRTIYVMGQSSLQAEGTWRTFKLERITYAKLTEKPFEIPAGFDGPALLKRSWGVMYGEEKPVEVKLRFSHRVTRRIKETLWHHSQKIVETPDGCEWTALIGDTLEIEPWIRGWGAECEVLAPLSLREQMSQEAHRLARLYDVLPQSRSDDDDGPDMDLLSQLF